MCTSRAVPGNSVDQTSPVSRSDTHCSVAMGDGGVYGRQSLRPFETAVIEYKNVRFLISERPSERNMERFIQEVMSQGAAYVVRLGGEPYQTDRLLDLGVQVIDLPFADGTAPSAEVLVSWCRLLRAARQGEERRVCVAVHCVAGLGRAPVMVAVALIELGMRYEDAVEFIRQKRRGAINAKQLDFLSHYRPKSRLSVNKRRPLCCVM